MSDWLFQGEPVTQLPDGYVGFVYVITNLLDGRRYFGKKILHFTKTKMLKGKKKRIKTESDWKTYYGSSDELCKDVERLGSDKFKREILHFCKNKGMMSYLEMRHQMDERVLENQEKFYNRQVHARVHASHVKI